LLAFALLLGVAFLTRSWWLPAVARFLDVTQPPEKVDAVLVLGGRVTARPFVGAALVKRGYAERVLLAALKPPYKAKEGFAIAEHEIARKVLLNRGVRPEQIEILPGEANSTEDEAIALARYLDQHPQARIAVVTDDHHTRRARLLIARAVGDRISQVIFVAAPTEEYDTDNWWQSEQGTAAYTTEYLKLIQALLS
jgi:uncharacterized SAM-binding protein YcdF (DUF218 family)